MWSSCTTTILLLVCLLSILLEASSRPFGAASLTFSRDRRDALLVRDPCHFHVTCRGGASSSTLVDSDVEDEVDSEDETDEEEEEIVSSKKSKSTLTASTMKAAEKAKAKKISSAKAALNSGLASASAATSTASAKKKSLWLKLKVPYILKASFNPLTLIMMTKAYWASLFNLNYLKKKEPSQDLRSALEEKAKKSSGGGSKGKRKFKPGQAKTLSDLPKLNT